MADSYRHCVFCDYQPTPPAAVLYEWPETLVIRPLNPVTDGHVLIVPKAHVANAADEPTITSATFARAAMWPQFHGRDEAFNLITSVGPNATQTVFHLHVHYVPRREDDGLLLPWTTAADPTPTVHTDPEPPTAGDRVVSLMGALEESIAEAKAARDAVKQARTAADPALDMPGPDTTEGGR